MSSPKNLTGKKVRDGIKHGMTIQDFCQKYECNEDELKARIERIFTVKNDARQIWNEVKANSKKPKGKATTNATTDTAVIDEMAEVEETNTTPHITLDELKAAESSHSNKTIELENAYKDCYQERRKGRERYNQLLKEIQELKKTYKEKGHEAEEIIQKDRELVSQMNEIYATYRDERAALEAIRSQIEEMTKIAICVYGNREIALFDETVEIDLDDTGHDEIFRHLREQEEAEDFRPRDLRIVAKLIGIVTNLNSPVEIIFEDEEIEKAYEVFRKSM